MKINRPKSNQPIPSNAKQVFSGKIFNVWQWDQKQFDSTLATFEKIKRTDTVNIIPITPDGKIILSKQEQPGIKPFIGVIGGRVDEDEEPLTAAKRELLEETGMVSNNWFLWDSIQLTEKIDWAIYTFVAKNCRIETDAHLDSGEQIELIKVDYDEFINETAQPDFRDIEISLKVYRSLNNPESLNKMELLLSL
jgi:ADP-ribose pyrophosphatase